MKRKNEKKYYIYKSLVRYTGLFVFIMTALLCFSGCKNDEGLLLAETEEITEIDNSDVSNIEIVEEIEASKEEALLIVHICGQVVNPGVYELPIGSRVIDGVNQAGGFTNTASQESINLAESLEDGIRLYIPSIEELEAGNETQFSYGGSKANSTAINDGLVNINKADIKELTTLPGIGETRAGAIIEYRDTNGPFKAIEDLKKVSGIGDASFEKLKDRIRV